MSDLTTKKNKTDTGLKQSISLLEHQLAGHIKMLEEQKNSKKYTEGENTDLKKKLQALEAIPNKLVGENGILIVSILFIYSFF